MLHAFFIAALVKLLLVHGSPLMCAVIFSAYRCLMELMFGDTLAQALVVGVASLGLSYVYFRLLDYFQDTATFWIVLILGFIVTFIV